jgi:CubicO group peptidase (beta-lactamase class C family)
MNALRTIALSFLLLSSAQPRAETRLTADTPTTTAAGTNFVAPKDWTLTRSGPAIVLEAPEAGSYIAVIDSRGKDADTAVAAAWAAYNAKLSWPLKLAVDRLAKDGWDQVRDYQYETSANEERSVYARALRTHTRWTVVIANTANAIDEKRGAQINKVFDRLLPKGYRRETFAGRKARTLNKGRVAALKEFVETARKQLDVPGVAIGIVQGGKLVYAGGFGVRELGKPEKVDANTLFMIASNTKALTTLMLAREVGQGRFGWDTPVTRVYPDFKLGDADTTRQVLMKHLICACTGLPRQDMEWLFESEGATPESVMRSLGTMQPTSKFGELFQYSNIMAAAAGYIGGHVEYPQLSLGEGYDKAIRREVFDPLGMSATTFDMAQALKTNHASAHARDIDDRTMVASLDLDRTIDSARPAGGAWSNVHDMLRYVQMELSKGMLPDGSRYIAEQPLLQRRVPQVALGNDADYGMGLMVDRKYGVSVVHHGGDLLGFHSDMIWLPDQNVGAVILTNADAGIYLRGPLQRRLLELLFDGRPEAALDAASAAERMHATALAERKRLTVPADSKTVAALAHRYRNAALGDIDVSQANGGTVFDFGGWRSDVASRRNDDGTVSMVTVSPGEDGIEFVIGAKAGKPILTLRDAQHEYVFDEVP